MQNSRTLGRSRSIRQVGFHSQTIALLSVALIGVWGCGGGTSQSDNNPPPTLTPTITTISPNTAAAGGAAFTLTINGTNFVAASTVDFGGAAPAATFISSTELTAAIPASSTASTGFYPFSTKAALRFAHEDADPRRRRRAKPSPPCNGKENVNGGGPNYGFFDLFTGECLFNTRSNSFADGGAGTAFANTMSFALTSFPYKDLLASLSGRKVEPASEIPANSPRARE
jgi:hypothetical protein